MTDPVNSKGAERVVSRRAPAAAAGRPAYKETGAAAPEVSPRGTERIARKAKQAAARVQADKDSLLVPPRGKDKAEQIARAKAGELAKFGPSTGGQRKVRQAANRVRADKEAVELAATKPRPLDNLPPGSQPTLLQLRQLSKLHQKEVRDETTEAAKEAGRAVRDVLRGRKLRNSPHTRFKKLAQQQDALQQSQANATA